MNKLFLISCAFNFALIGYARNITFTTIDYIPIPDVNCIGYTANNDSVCFWKSGLAGEISINNNNVDYIAASHPDYQKATIYPALYSKDTVVLYPRKVVDLKEFVVTPADVTEFENYSSYYISQADMAKYTNVY